MSDDPLITKRIHVSGLTPSITPADLSQKLGSFGTVKELDGFGKLDALGQPRKFGYVTIETTKPKLARCMNLLSGVTWKGAKLRLGEAKPDFRERLAAERQAMEDGEPPRKKRRLPRGVQGVHASDMSLVTPENVAERGGWKVTPLGRIVKPIRMRPEHPLPPPLVPSSSTSTKTKKGDKGKKAMKRRRVKEPPVRARRRTIDPLKWGSTQLKGVFLENAGASVLEEGRYTRPLVTNEVVSSESEESDEGEEENEVSPVNALRDSEPASELQAEVAQESTATQTQQVTKQATPVPQLRSQPTRAPDNAVVSDLLEEKNAALGLLQSLFGDRDDRDWGGRESVASDVEMDEPTGGANTTLGSTGAPGDDFEEVPMTVDVSVPNPHNASEEVGPVGEHVTPEEVPKSQAKPEPKTKLKDLFAPQEESAGFSLLGHLDLDLELDDDTLDPAFTTAPTLEPTVDSTPPPLPSLPSGPTRAGFTIDPSAPLFFPLPESEKGRMKDSLDVAREKGWDWRGFCRTQTAEEIKQRWEGQKVELTRDWKRRHREAVKSRRRRGGGDGE